MPEPKTRIVPVFPLTGTLLLPGNFLPLNIFEARYRRLVEDTLGLDRLVGLVQPKMPAPDNWGPVAGSPECPEIYSIGCVGKIKQHERQPDGRFLILLEGYCRFRVREELPLLHGYRRVRANFDEFEEDIFRDSAGIDFERLIASAIAFAEKHEIDFDRDVLESLPPLRLLHALCAALPFAPGEKQALLEAAGAAERQQLLLALMEMYVDVLPGAGDLEAPTVH